MCLWVWVYVHGHWERLTRSEDAELRSQLRDDNWAKSADFSTLLYEKCLGWEAQPPSIWLTRMNNEQYVPPRHQITLLGAVCCSTVALRGVLLHHFELSCVPSADKTRKGLLSSPHILRVMGKAIHAANCSQPGCQVIWNWVKYSAEGHGLLRTCCLGKEHSNILNSKWCRIPCPNSSISNLQGHLQNGTLLRWWLQEFTSSVMECYQPILRS